MIDVPVKLDGPVNYPRIAGQCSLQFFVPMLMLPGISPELTQAAYRVGDSTTNIITPMMPYFPLVVVFCQRYVKETGIGTVTAMMLPYSISFLVFWSALLFYYWGQGWQLGIQGGYEYVAPVIEGVIGSGSQ